MSKSMTSTAAATMAAVALSGSASAQASHPVLEPAAQTFAEAAAQGKPIYQMTPTEARAALSGAQNVPVAKLPVSIEEEVFPVGQNGKVRVLIYRPQGATGKLPIIVHIHGGGWVLGGPDTHDRMTREIAVVDDITETEALKKIEGQLAKSPRRLSKAEAEAEAEMEGDNDDLAEEAA